MALTPEELEQMKKAAAAQVPLMPAGGVNPLARGIEMAGGNPSVLQPTPPQITAQTAGQDAVGQMAERGVVQTSPASFGRPELMPQQLPEGADVNIGFDKPSTPLTTPEATAIRETEQGLTSTLNIDGGSVTVPQSLASQTFGVPNAPMGVEATKQRLQEIFGTDAPVTLNQGITGNPDAVMAPDFQGRMRSFENQGAATQNLEAGQAAYDAASQARSDAAGLSPSGAYKRSDAAVSDAERRGEKPFSTYVDLAGGDTDLARAYQQREREGLDMMTGQEPESTQAGGLTPYQALSASQRQQEIDMKVREGMEAKEAKAEQQFEEDTAAYETVTDNAGRLAGLAEEAIGLTMEGGTTGIGGALLKHIPGTDANQLKEVLAVVQSDVALQRLANLKATGATLGQISKPELDMLQNSFDALRQNLKGDRLRQALVNYSQNLANVEKKISDGYQSKYNDRLTKRTGQASKQTVDYGDSNYEIVQ